MTILDWQARPYIGQDDMAVFEALDSKTAVMYGRTVRAAEISNFDYKIRFSKYSSERKMSPPPSCGRIFLGYLVVRRLGSSDEYETWIPDHVFEELYISAASEA